MKVGKLALLLSEDESYLIEVCEKKIHTKSGIVHLKKLERKNYGDEVKTHLGRKFTIIKPNIKDILEKKVKRSPQIVTPKDASLILAYTGIEPGSLVIDAGCGSGFLAIFLANYIKPGKVVTYEKNPKFAKVARENISLTGLKNITVKEKDILKGIDEKNIDLITLDMKDVEKVIKNTHSALKPGGWLAIYSPHIEQVKKVINEIRRYEFTQEGTLENIVREWQSEHDYTRPKTLGVMHTGWVTFGRKIK